MISYCEEIRMVPASKRTEPFQSQGYSYVHHPPPTSPPSSSVSTPMMRSPICEDMMISNENEQEDGVISAAQALLSLTPGIAENQKKSKTSVFSTQLPPPMVPYMPMETETGRWMTPSSPRSKKAFTYTTVTAPETSSWQLYQRTSTSCTAMEENTTWQHPRTNVIIRPTPIVPVSIEMHPGVVVTSSAPSSSCHSVSSSSESTTISSFEARSAEGVVPFSSPPSTKKEKTSTTPPPPTLLSPPNTAVSVTSYYSGTISLATNRDSESLSPLHCFMRRYCVEAFSATQDDISSPRYGKSHSGRVVIGQVGIRCIHCKHRPAKSRQERAVCFPSSLKNIYHSIETWQRRHSLVCQDIPSWIKRSMTELIHNSRAGAGGRRQYWEESALRLGMATTDHGIRFIRPPGDIGPARGDWDNDGSSTFSLDDAPSVSVVAPQDRELVTDYLFTLLEQMEACRFTEQDRCSGRSKVKNCPAGFPGMQCKHCGGKAGFGRYFPANVMALSSANSDRNIYNHVIKCRRCPQEVRASLQRMHYGQAQCKNRRGSRKQFFQRVWNRLHEEGKQDDTITSAYTGAPVAPVSPVAPVAAALSNSNAVPV